MSSTNIIPLFPEKVNIKEAVSSRIEKKELDFRLKTKFLSLFEKKRLRISILVFLAKGLVRFRAEIFVLRA